MARVDPADAATNLYRLFELYTNTSDNKNVQKTKELYDTANKCTELYQTIMNEPSDKPVDFSNNPHMKDLMDELRQKGVLKIEGYKISQKERSTVTSGLLTQSNALKSEANAITQFVLGSQNKLKMFFEIARSFVHTEERMKDKALSRMVPGVS